MKTELSNSYKSFTIFSAFAKNSGVLRLKESMELFKKSTGGSRNILVLSKLGQIEAGSVAGTLYEYSDPARMYGGIKFFDIDPDDISHLGKIWSNREYHPIFILSHTILFCNPNKILVDVSQ